MQEGKDRRRRVRWLRRQRRPQVLRVRGPDVHGHDEAGVPRRAGAAGGEAALQVPRLFRVRRRTAARREGRGDHLPRRFTGTGRHERRARRGAHGREPPRPGHRGRVRGGRRSPMKRPVAELWGTGRYTPKRVMTNDEFSRLLDTSDQWIRERTGIRERRVAGPDESNACMAKAAAEQVLGDTGLTPLDLDAVVVATCSPDRLLPSQACDLQALLGAKHAAAFDVGAACTGFLYALNVAEGLVASEQARHVLVVASEKLTSIMDWSDRTTAVLFGDGAGATIVRPSATGRGILSSYMKSDGTLAELLYRPGGGAAHPPDEALLKDHSYYIKMAGREVFKAAVLSMADACDTALTRAGLTAADIDLLIPHQANIRIIEATAKHAGLPMDKVYVNVDRFGNTSAASVAIALDEAVRCGRVQPGMKVMFCAFGAGFTWASMVVQW